MSGAEPSAAAAQPRPRNWTNIAADGISLGWRRRCCSDCGCGLRFVSRSMSRSGSSSTTPSWAGTTAAIVCQPHLGASLRKGWFRMIGTVVGAVAIVVMTACFPQDRAAFLVSLALWGAACALVATLLRNFAAYSAALAGYTAAIIASDQLGAAGGLNGQAFMLAVDRASEICIGIVCAGVVLAATDLGGARRRLATLFAAISAEISRRVHRHIGERRSRI